LVTLTVAPGETLSDIGMNMKFEMVIVDPPLDEPDGGRATHARRATAAGGQEQGARNHRTPAPHFNRFRISYAAALVELNAMGEPAVVCEPGYMPIT
jgi:hypothetical protein